MMETALPVTYDRYGRMQYHPELHAKHMLPWTTGDERFLVENYEALGPEQISLALERTIHTVMTRVCKLRREGRMPKASEKKHHHRIRTSN